MRDERRVRVLLWTVYAALAVFVLTEKWGQATSDTRFELTEVPGPHLAGTFHLWNPEVSLGELQNQAYGYLFPHGSFFWLAELAGVPGWLAQRGWSVLLLVVACEGVRRLARTLGTSPGAAALAGLAYGLTPRHVTEIGTRSAEVLPGAVLPWALLPVVLAAQGRLRPRNAAILSAAAFACSGGVNGTATAAPAALLAVAVGWTVLTRRLSWRFGVGWFALVGAVSAWWVLSLLRLGAYSPPFFDFVEDARTTTSTSGFGPVLRGASNWVGYISVGGQRWWPAGYDLAYEPWLVLGSGIVAVAGFVGLLRMRSAWRTPLLLAAVFGLTCQVIAHTGALDGPFSQALRDLLDGPLAPLRNVPKVDPVLRVPIALGLAVVVDDLVRLLLRRRDGRLWRPVVRRGIAGGVVLFLVGGLVAMAQPILSADTRTPGWKQVPSYWTQAAAFLEKRSGASDRSGGATWVIPGSGFGIQQWGWTMEEPMEAVARSPWITRSQVPLTPPATIRLFTAMEAYLETGSGSPYLRHLLNRLGIDTVLVRHDLDTDVAQATSASLVGVALGRSPGLQQVATFGELEFGPAIEVFDVEPAEGAQTGTGGYDVRDVDDAVTVAGSVEAAVAAVGSGLVGPAQAMVLEGEESWKHAGQVVGDGYRRRERAFGRNQDAESNVMTPTDRYHGDRVVPNYPGSAGSEPVVAKYDGIAGVDASTSRAWTSSLGPVHPENAPWSALDGDPSTYWRPSPYLDARGQWLEVDLGRERTVDEVTLSQPTVEDVERVTRWRVTAGGHSRILTADPFTGEGTVRLGVRADRVRVEALGGTSRNAAIGIAELDVDGIRATRTLVVPEASTDAAPDLVFAAAPEARACVLTVFGADCDRYRAHASEEATGIDRTFTLDQAGRFAVRGVVVARSLPGTLPLLQPGSGTTMTGSSWLSVDPAASPRMAYDGSDATSWIADPRDTTPVLEVDLGRERTLRRISLTPPAGVAVLPDHAQIRARTADGEEVREVDLRGFGGFEPVRARRLSITFSRSADRVGGAPLGMGELHLGGVRAVPLDGGAPTGAVCGYGPQLVLDGRVVDTRVHGFLGDVVAAGQLAVEPCDDAGPLRLSAGTHRVELRSTQQFQPVGLTLDAVGSGAEPGRVHPRSRTIRLLSTADTRVRLDVGPGQDAILSSPHNVNVGWVATVDGHELERVTVDGWAQGWLLPAGTSGEVELGYAPQRGYLVVLVGGLGVLGAVLLAALGILVSGALRRHRGPADALPDTEALEAPIPEEPAPSRRRTVLAAVIGGLVAGLVGGPVVAVGGVVGALLARWPRVAQALVGVVLLGALVAFVLALRDGPVLPSRAADLVTGAALAAGVAAALTRRTPG
ncbi:alpha-(1-_3)-arabinofuranosyltransferase family protein [Nocardioides kongjuensis]|uniref:Arabinofuranan 3-O-arabinosyltransferase n=1 Tax=Nocardioides kongjuensis TaxID=349522 RepID=A0A852RAS4_9ACTN|nr:alpha-(1->3)-arabinofuranosyltransferase family protein [Nocardioides kongjuensis]NYD30177.1 arabinofuranan 3-O-arabinosyltransferase [Nocardioides kongjuensis]